MRRTLPVLAVALLVSGCGEQPAEDRTPALVRCFEQHGGVQVTRLSQLDRFPSSDPQYGTGFGLESISFDSLDVAAGPGDVRQALVLIRRPQLEGTRFHEAANGLRRARQGRTDAIRMIVMPASVDYDRPLNDCAEQVAGEQIYP
jgi:hypothetical protein